MQDLRAKISNSCSRTCSVTSVPSGIGRRAVPLLIVITISHRLAVFKDASFSMLAIATQAFISTREPEEAVCIPQKSHREQTLREKNRRHVRLEVIEGLLNVLTRPDLSLDTAELPLFRGRRRGTEGTSYVYRESTLSRADTIEPSVLRNRPADAPDPQHHEPLRYRREAAL